jgi:hypothetical protein
MPYVNYLTALKFVVIFGKFNVVGIYSTRNYAQKWITELCLFIL